MGGGTRSKTTQEPQVPQYAQPLMQQTGELSASLQRAMPLEPFGQAKPLKIAQLSGKEKQAGDLLSTLNELSKRRVTACRSVGRRDLEAVPGSVRPRRGGLPRP